MCPASGKENKNENVVFERLNGNKYGLRQIITVDKSMFWSLEMITSILLASYFSIPVYFTTLWGYWKCLDRTSRNDPTQPPLESNSTSIILIMLVEPNLYLRLNTKFKYQNKYFHTNTNHFAASTNTNTGLSAHPYLVSYYTFSLSWGPVSRRGTWSWGGGIGGILQ